MKTKRFGIKAAGIAGVIALLATVTCAETIWIKSEVVEIRSGKGAIYPVIAKVKKGQELTVIEHDGSWYKVAVPPADPATVREGYVFESSISPKKVNGPGPLSGLKADTDMSTAAAAKGLQPTAENYASTKGMSSAPLNNLIAIRNKIDPREWERFKAEGHVGAR